MVPHDLQAPLPTFETKKGKYNEAAIAKSKKAEAMKQAQERLAEKTREAAEALGSKTRTHDLGRATLDGSKVERTVAGTIRSAVDGGPPKAYMPPKQPSIVEHISLSLAIAQINPAPFLTNLGRGHFCAALAAALALHGGAAGAAGSSSVTIRKLVPAHMKIHQAKVG
jgi:hypothetical protein